MIPEDWTIRDLTICGTWSFNTYDTPRILDQIARKAPGRANRDQPHRLEDVVEQGIEALADPAGDQVKVLVGGAREGHRLLLDSGRGSSDTCERTRSSARSRRAAPCSE